MSVARCYNSGMAKKNKKNTVDPEKTSTTPPAIKRSWIMPIRLALSLVVLGCMAYIFFNIGDLEVTHVIIFIPVAAVVSMVFLDCKMSERYWNEQDKLKNSGENNPVKG